MNNRIIKWGLTLSSLLLLSGCGLVDRIQENRKNDPTNLSPEQVANIYASEQLQEATQKHLKELTQFSGQIQTTFTKGDLKLTKDQLNYESFKDQSMTGYQITTDSHAGDISLKEAFVMKDNAYYHQLDQGAFVKSEQPTKQPFSYLFYIKLLLEGKDTWDIKEINDHTLEVTRQLKDDETVKSAKQLIDLPIIPTNQATYDFHLTYHIDKQTGAIQSASITTDIQDLGQSMQLVQQLSQTTFNNQAKPLDINTDAEAATASDLKADFLANNPYQAITTYEYQTVHRVKDDQQMTFSVQNTLQGAPYLTIQAPVKDNKAGDYAVNYANKHYALDGEQVAVSDQADFNPYAHFVKRFHDKLDSLTKIEDTENKEALYYREFYTERSDEFNQAIGATNIDSFQHGDKAVYGIDYLVDAKTHRLVTVVIWNGSQDSESIDHGITYGFGSLNSYSPSILSEQVNPKIWEQLAANHK